MTTDELIRALREQANTNGCWNDGCWNKCKRLLAAAADRLEELDERVAIMTEPGTDPACEPDGASPNPVPTAVR